MKTIQSKLAVVFCIFLALGVAGIVLAFMNSQKDDGAVINLAGKQRMLTQKMSKEAIALSQGIGSKKILEETANLFDKTLKGLIAGNEELKLSQTKDPKVISQLNNVQELWKEFRVNVDAVLANPAGAAAALSYINENNIKFIIIGGGHKESYIKMAKDLNLKNVIFTDHLENPYPAINALDVFTLLSTAHEGVSQASLQALFLQKPIIATKTGGLKEVCIDKKTGIQVPIFSSIEVAKAILKLQKDDKLRKTYAKNAKELALKFSEDNMIVEMKKVYEKLINYLQLAEI